MSCSKEFQITVEGSCVDCMGVTTDVDSITWAVTQVVSNPGTSFAFTPSGGGGTADSSAAGSGSGGAFQNRSFFRITASFCNNTPVAKTVRFSFNITGSLSASQTKYNCSAYYSLQERFPNLLAINYVMEAAVLSNPTPSSSTVPLNDTVFDDIICSACSITSIQFAFDTIAAGAPTGVPPQSASASASVSAVLTVTLL